MDPPRDGRRIRRLSGRRPSAVGRGRRHPAGARVTAVVLVLRRRTSSSRYRSDAGVPVKPHLTTLCPTVAASATRRRSRTRGRAASGSFEPSLPGLFRSYRPLPAILLYPTWWNGPPCRTGSRTRSKNGFGSSRRHRGTNAVPTSWSRTRSRTTRRRRRRVPDADSQTRGTGTPVDRASDRPEFDRSPFRFFEDCPSVRDADRAACSAGRGARPAPASPQRSLRRRPGAFHGSRDAVTGGQSPPNPRNRRIPAVVRVYN